MGQRVTAPSVSIVIPFFATPRTDALSLEFLAECLQSISGQTFRDWEAIVVDDGSVYESEVKAQVERLGDDRVRCLRHPVNRGLGAARNTGFAAAQGSVFLPVDADDRLHPTFLEKTYAALSESDNTDAVFTHFRLFGAVDGVAEHQVRQWPTILRKQWIPGPGVLMRRHVWELAGGYAEILGLHGNEDWDFWIGAFENDARVAAVAEALYEYRRWPGALTFQYPPLDGHSAREIIYLRHQESFDAHELGRQFLVEGYLNSSLAAERAGFGAVAVLDAMRGLRRTPGEPRLWVRMFSALLPRVLQDRARARYEALRAPGALSRLRLYGLGLIGRRRYRAIKQRWWNARAPDLHERWGDRTADFDVLSRIVREHAISSVLDVGCGHGRLFGLWQSLGVRPTGVDIAPWAVARARSEYPGVRVLCMALEDFQPDEEVDLVVSNRTFQHLEPQVLASVLSKLCASTKWLYLNEMMPVEGAAAWYLWLHDYERLLAERGFHFVETGRIGSQRWSLYAGRRLEPRNQ